MGKLCILCKLMQKVIQIYDKKYFPSLIYLSFRNMESQTLSEAGDDAKIWEIPPYILNRMDPYR